MDATCSPGVSEGDGGSSDNNPIRDPRSDHVPIGQVTGAAGSSTVGEADNPIEDSKVSGDSASTTCAAESAVQLRSPPLTYAQALTGRSRSHTVATCYPSTYLLPPPQQLLDTRSATLVNTVTPAITLTASIVVDAPSEIPFAVVDTAVETASIKTLSDLGKESSSTSADTAAQPNTSENQVTSLAVDTAVQDTSSIVDTAIQGVSSEISVTSPTIDTVVQDISSENQATSPVDACTIVDATDPVISKISDNADQVTIEQTLASLAFPVETPLASAAALRSEPPLSPFRESITQTEDILNIRTHPQFQLSSIESELTTVHAALSFQLAWTSYRVRSSSFPGPAPTSTHSVGAVSPPITVLQTGSLQVQTFSASDVARRLLDRAPQSQSPTKKPPVNRHLSFTPVKTSLQQNQRLTEDSTLQTPINTSQPITKTSNFETPIKTNQSITATTPLDQPHDTPEHKRRISHVMDNIDKACVQSNLTEWSHPQEQVTPRDPEQLTVLPQPPNSYTTVGSLRPTTAQHFSAPNRIQRDGTGRRATQASLQGRVNDSQLGPFGGRNMTQQYNSGYGSGTNPQYGTATYPQHGFTGQSQYVRPNFSNTSFGLQPDFGSATLSQHGPRSRFDVNLPTQPQAGAAAQHQFGAVSQPHYGDPHQSEYDTSHISLRTPINRYDNRSASQYGSVNPYNSGLSAPSDFRNLHDTQSRGENFPIPLSDEERRALENVGVLEPMIDSSMPAMRPGNVATSRFGLMPTIDYALTSDAQSVNIQDQSRGRESRQLNFTETHSLGINSTGTRTHRMTSMHPVVENAFSESSIGNSHQTTMSNTTYKSQQSAMTGNTTYSRTLNTGNNRRNTGHESQASGGLDRTYRFPPPGFHQPSQSTSHSQQGTSSLVSNELLNTNQPNIVQVSQWQPLTAGPPRQRQTFSAVPDLPIARGSQSGPTPMLSQGQVAAFPLNSPWQTGNRNSQWSSVQNEHNQIRDTLPPAEVHGYYPNGFPTDMTGQFTRIPEIVNENRPGMSGANQTNTWYQSGLANLDMTSNDHIAAMERRNRQLEDGPDAQLDDDLDEYGNPRTLQGLVASSDPLTIEEINQMDITEVTARLAQPVFGTLLLHADRRPSPNSIARLARYAPGAPWTIDDTPQGNQSFFGEDVGPTPRRVGRDPRYQPFE